VWRRLRREIDQSPGPSLLPSPWLPGR
jgi:hypothetical protein